MISQNNLLTNNLNNNKTDSSKPDFRGKKMPLLKALELWVQSNNPTQLALALGYRSSNTIHQWLKRGRIPRHQEDRVKQFLKVNKNGNA
jgi:hypothetical protein